MVSNNTIKASIAGWNFDNSYTRLPQSFFVRQNPIPIKRPELVLLNHAVAKTLGLDAEWMISPEGAALFAGNVIPEGAEPIAQAYAGHQFGHFTMLGDGRAILLGEQITPDGQRFDLQFKGSGRTPFSRGGDGRAALGPMLREYIISEAMAALGIPTTRSLAVVTTGEPVYRDSVLPGAILTRVAASHIRVGTFQYAMARGNTDELKQLADYTIDRHYPELKEAENPYLELLHSVMARQAFLVTQWQMAGFIHGVMNTDNMTLSGETIDYGPCAFMDVYDPQTVFSSIDQWGRYAYGNQPLIAQWNLTRLAETLLPLIHTDQETSITMAEDAIAQFPDVFGRYWLKGMKAKLGLISEDAEDPALIEAFLGWMQANQMDFTNTFRLLSFNQIEDAPFFIERGFSNWYVQWQARLKRQPEPWEAVKALMNAHNPAVIPRNHKVEEALDAAVEQNDLSVMESLLAVLKHPYEEQTIDSSYTLPPGPGGVPYRTFCGT